jgi:hypothetical protein
VKQECNWILLDYVDVGCTFPKTQTFYSLERLWGDAEIVRVDEGKKSEKKSEKKSVKKGRPKPRPRRSSSVRKEAS